MTRLLYAEPDQWATIHKLQGSPPPLDAHERNVWIHTQHIATPYEPSLGKALDKLMRHHVGTNECWLAVSGASHLGKSTAIAQLLLGKAMARADQWRTRTSEGYLHTPYVYVEVTSKEEARGLLASIARACGLPDSGTEKDLHKMLSSLLPLLGVRLIVVDDAQMLRRVSDVASRLTDGLRHLLHLPVPFVYVGIDLERSALLRDPGRNNDTVYQLQRRALQLRLTPISACGGEGQIVDLVRGYARQVRSVPELRTDCLRDPRLMAALAGKVEGRPGSLLNTLKRASIEALALNDGVITADLVMDEASSVIESVRERESA